MGGGGGKPKPKKQEPEVDPMLEYLKKMSKQQTVVVKDVDTAQKEALLESQRQSALASAQQGEIGARQTLSQAGIMQQARDLASQQKQQQAYGAMGESAVGAGFDINQAKQQQMANIGGTGTIPSGAKIPFYGYDQNQDSGATGKYANIFNLPKTQGITFGGQ
jgi:hypothetical protein